ncbi:hypothetical protein CHS0354_023531 [Potamilus streckersoni]|uniref:Uncharacterized protein n=1 Tax=Potamilus streckersoni TaxID=2493646 RepID=A0AAE0VKK5_9BIVA|nr:hypothetical protein CHS0354_023531 [Potamilus streckersoni]
MCCLLDTFPLTSAWLQNDKPDDETNTTEVAEWLSAVQGPVAYLGQESRFVIPAVHGSASHEVEEWNAPQDLHLSSASGVSSLLFQCAVSQANRDIMVTYISPRPFSRMPLSVHGMPCPSSASSLKTLTFQYLSSLDELVKFCCNVHMRVLHPQVLIIDDMQYYIEQSKGQGQEAAAARLCAVLLDAVHFIHKENPDTGCCLLVSCQSKIKSLQAVFRQFKFNILTIENTASLSDRVFQADMNIRERKLSLTYQVQTSGIFLRESRFVQEN